MKILMVLTSHDTLGDTGLKTGFWLEEFAAPFYVFKDRNCEVTLASPKGGAPPLDPNSWPTPCAWMRSTLPISMPFFIPEGTAPSGTLRKTNSQ
jgi:putative intracellular protease/amidase